MKRPNLTFREPPDGGQRRPRVLARARPTREAIGLADAELARFVANQKELGLWERTVMFVVSDHSMDTTLQKQSLRIAFTAGGISDSEYLAVQNGSVDMVYLKDRDRPDRDEILKRMREIALGTAGVDEALYRVDNPADGGAQNTPRRCIPAGGSPASAPATSSSRRSRAARSTSPTR